MFPTRSSCGRILIHISRETERDWDKELADDVKVECESKYGKVEAIKVEKETQVCPCCWPGSLSLTRHREKFISSLIPSNRRSKPSKDWMVDGSADARFLQHSFQTPLCKPISRTPYDLGWPFMDEMIMVATEIFISFMTDPNINNSFDSSLSSLVIRNFSKWAPHADFYFLPPRSSCRQAPEAGSSARMAHYTFNIKAPLVL